MASMPYNFERTPMHLTNLKDHNHADHQYGRRIETDRSWTVYHVFTGVPADANAGATTGLNRAEATDRMMSLNRHIEERTAHRSAIPQARCCADIRSAV